MLSVFDKLERIYFLADKVEITMKAAQMFELLLLCWFREENIAMQAESQSEGTYLHSPAATIPADPIPVEAEHINLYCGRSPRPEQTLSFT